MNLTDTLGWHIDALRYTQGQSMIDTLEAVKAHIEKLEQDRKVLRWALQQARTALLKEDTHLNNCVVSVIDTTQAMTEPANDR